MNATSVPFFSSFASRSTSQLVRRTQPCRLRLADLGGVRGAVNAIAFRRQADPVRAGGVVRPGPDREGLLGFDALELVVRIVTIARMRIDRRHLEDAAGRRLLLAADARREKRDQSAVLSESLHGLGGLVDLDTRDDRPYFLHDDIRHRDRLAGLVEFLAGIERLEQRLAHMKSFGDGFARTGVVQRLQVLHVVHFRRQLVQERTLHVLLGDLVIDDHRIRADGKQAQSRLPKSAVACCREPLGLRKTPCRAFSAFSPSLPSISPGEKLARSSSTCALTTAG